MKDFADLVARRPVRFYLLLNAILALLPLYGVPITELQLGGILAVVNALMAFLVDNFTTPVNSNGDPLNPDYMKVSKDTR